MLGSVRRIANTLIVVGVLSMSLSALSSLSINCGAGGAGCLAQLIGTYDIASYETNTAIARSTVSYVEGGAAVTLSDVNAFVQATSMYILLLAVIMLVLLECLELHYIRRLVKRRGGILRFKF